MFTIQERYEACKWGDDVISPMGIDISVNKDEVTNIIGLMSLSQLKGGIAEGPMYLGLANLIQRTNKNTDVLNKAPVSNMDAERQIGKINFELSIRGAKELPAESSSVVKSQTFDLIAVREHDAYRVFRKSPRRSVWPKMICERGREPEKIVKRSNLDLQKLNAMGVPFICSADVKMYVSDNLIADSQKSKRSYLEVLLVLAKV